jgi:hypothetical protein
MKSLLDTVMTSISELRKSRETRTAALAALIKAQERGQKDSTYWPPTVKEGVGCTQTVLTMNIPFQDAAEYSHWLDDVEMTPEEEAEEYRLRPSKMSKLQLWHLMHPQRLIIGDTILVRKTGTKANVFDLTFEAKDVPSEEELFTLVHTLKALADRTNGVINILQHGKEGR